MREPALRHPAAGAAPPDDGRVQVSEFVPDEVSLDLRMSWRGAADRISYACDLAGRLPGTFARWGRGHTLGSLASEAGNATG
jgi:hypothetical protein